MAADDEGFNFKSLKIGSRKFSAMSDQEKDEHKEWLKYLYDRKEKGRLDSYIRSVQRKFVKFARKEGNVVDMRKLLELATYIRYMADHATPDGFLVCIPYDEIQKAFRKGSDGKWQATGIQLSKIRYPGRR